jgi:hypothetical protein
MAADAIRRALARELAAGAVWRYSDRARAVDHDHHSHSSEEFHRPHMTELTAWDNFYVIVGTAAGALIGLQFVVATLIAGRPSLRVAEAGAAFATPTINHFGAALLLSAILCAPWRTIVLPAVLWGFMGLSGVAYTAIVARRMRRQTVYQPEFEDWLFHVVLPLAAYAILALSSCAAPGHTRQTLFAVGAAALILLFVGIHNAWDSIAYHVFVNRQDTED